MHKDLTLPHMQPLVEFVLRMRDRYVDGYVPNFDPDDGGVNAEILFLFEKPGPKTEPTEGGSGFISQDNNDPTAKATKDFLLKAGIDRKKIIIWNSISAWNGTIRYTKKEMTHTKQELEELLSLLPALRWIVLVGRNAQKITKLVDLSSYKVLNSPHPSPKVRSTNPEVWKSIPVIWRQTNKRNHEKYWIIGAITAITIFVISWYILDVIPCDSPRSVGPDCEEIIQELERQEG